jgi:hypothetical protein
MRPDFLRGFVQISCVSSPGALSLDLDFVAASSLFTAPKDFPFALYSFRVGLCSCFSAESFSRSGFLIRVSVLLFPKRSSAVQFSFTQIGAGYFLLGVSVFASASCLRSGVLWNCVFFSARGRFSFGPLRSCRFFV